MEIANSETKTVDFAAAASRHRQDMSEALRKISVYPRYGRKAAWRFSGS